MKNMRGMGVVCGLLGGVLGVLAPEAAYSETAPGSAAHAQSHTSYVYGNGMIINTHATSSLSLQIPIEMRLTGNLTISARLRGNNTTATTCRAYRSDGTTVVQSDLLSVTSITPSLVTAPNTLSVTSNTHLYFGCSLPPNGGVATVSWS